MNFEKGSKVRRYDDLNSVHMVLGVGTRCVDSDGYYVRIACSPTSRLDYEFMLVGADDPVDCLLCIAEAT